MLSEQIILDCHRRCRASLISTGNGAIINEQNLCLTEQQQTTRQRQQQQQRWWWQSPRSSRSQNQIGYEDFNTQNVKMLNNSVQHHKAAGTLNGTSSSRKRSSRIAVREDPHHHHHHHHHHNSLTQKRSIMHFLYMTLLAVIFFTSSVGANYGNVARFIFSSWCF